jgi:hypothetical protein
MQERASAAVASLQGKLRLINRGGGGGGQARKTGARERNLSITITQSQSSTGPRRRLRGHNRGTQEDGRMTVQTIQWGVGRWQQGNMTKTAALANAA